MDAFEVWATYVPFDSNGKGFGRGIDRDGEYGMVYETENGFGRGHGRYGGGTGNCRGGTYTGCTVVPNVSTNAYGSRVDAMLDRMLDDLDRMLDD